jgi:hypothetical protein
MILAGLFNGEPEDWFKWADELIPYAEGDFVLPYKKSTNG